jgi:hypothetical protein
VAHSKLAPQRFDIRVDLNSFDRTPIADVGWAAINRRVVPKTAVSNRSKPTLYSITSSARPISGSGIVRPRSLAVFRLMINLTLVACWTGRSAGFLPLRIWAV